MKVNAGGNVVELPPKPGHKRSDDAKRERMAEFVEWLATPEETRSPSTRVAFAEKLGVTTQTLRNYERERWVQVELTKRQKTAFKVERAADVVDALFTIATEKFTAKGDPSSASVSAAKTLLDWMDRSVEHQDADFESMTDDELVAFLQSGVRFAKEQGLM